MDPVAITIGVCWIVVGLICVGLAVPLVQGKVRQNALYGVRFPQSFQSDEAWFAINRYGAKRLMIWAMPMIVAGVTACFLPLQTRPWAALLCGLLPLAFVLIPLLEAWNFARQYPAGP
jgi:uncharacterized membrane protein